MVTGLDPGNVIRGLRALLHIGYRMPIPVTPDEFADAGQRQSWRREKNMIVLKLWSDDHRRTPVYIFVYEPFDFPSEYPIAKWHSLASDIQVLVISYEALVSMKTAARRLRDCFVPSGRGNNRMGVLIYSSGPMYDFATTRLSYHFLVRRAHVLA
jgi:hypothetical protein